MISLFPFKKNEQDGIYTLYSIIGKVEERNNFIQKTGRENYEENKGNELEKGREGGKGLSFNMGNYTLGDRGN